MTGLLLGMTGLGANQPHTHSCILTTMPGFCYFQHSTAPATVPPVLFSQCEMFGQSGSSAMTGPVAGMSLQISHTIRKKVTFCVQYTFFCSTQQNTWNTQQNTTHPINTYSMCFVYQENTTFYSTHTVHACVYCKNTTVHTSFQNTIRVCTFSKYTDKMCTALGFSLQWLSRLEGASKTSFNLCLSSLINCVLIRLHFDCLFEQNESIQTASCHKVWAEEECIHMC